MKDELKKQTCVIIRKNGEYLGSRILESPELRWTTSPYEAWKTRDKDKAKEIARRTGGVTVLWNPIVRQMRVI